MINPLPARTLLKGGKYRVQSLHRLGGQSIVYEGLEVESEQRVIIKQTYQDQEWSHEVIQQEANLLGSLQHRSLPKVLDCFTEEGSTFLIMSRVPGNDLGELLRKQGHPFPYLDVLEWCRQLLDILQYLQTQETAIIHRDINPKNIRLTPDNQIVLLDFGIAKKVNSKTLLLGGTPRYAPPEQLKDEGTDRRSDLYALTATIYYLLTAVEPPDSLSREASILRGMPDPLRPILELNDNVPPLIAQVLFRALNLDRRLRPADAAAMRQWLDEASEGRYCDEEVTLTTLNDSVDPDRTRVSTRSTGRANIPVGTGERGDVTHEAQRLINILNDDKQVPPGLIQALVEMMDGSLNDKKEILSRYSELISKSNYGVPRIAANLIQSLASGALIAPKTSQQLREKLGALLADNVLSEFSAGNAKQNTTKSDYDESQLAATLQQHLISRKLMRGLAVWVVRGIVTIIITQLIVGLITKQTLLGLLTANNRGIIWAVHIALAGIVFLLILLARRMNVVSQTGSGKYVSACYWTGFCFGVTLTMVLFHDLM